MAEGWSSRFQGAAASDRRPNKRRLESRRSLLRRRQSMIALPVSFGVLSCPMGNTFGQLFRITTFGESHGGGVGVVIDGCPPNISLSLEDIQQELDRRRPGQSSITTQRQEEDRCEILSGTFSGKTLGTPISVLVRNRDARPEDYAAM